MSIEPTFNASANLIAHATQVVAVIDAAMDDYRHGTKETRQALHVAVRDLIGTSDAE